jgi:hypothetical protein
MNPWPIGLAFVLAVLIYTCHWCPSCEIGRVVYNTYAPTYGRGETTYPPTYEGDETTYPPTYTEEGSSEGQGSI